MLNRRIKVKLFKIKILKHEPNFSFLQLGVFVIVFAVLGLFVVNSFATSTTRGTKAKTVASTRYDLMQNFGGPGGNLSAALAWLASNPQTGGSFVSSGTYNYSNVLDIPAGADIEFRSVTLLPQVIQNEAVRVRGSGTKINFTGTSKIGYTGRCAGLNCPIPRYGNAEASGLEFEGASNFYVHADNLTIEGMGSVGVFLYRTSGPGRFEGKFTVTGSGEDSYHVTQASHDICFCADLYSYNSGDDSFAVVSYAENPIVHDIYWLNVWAAGQRWGRGVSVVGGQNVTVHSYYILGSAGAGVYIAAESLQGAGYDTLGVDHVRLDSGQISNPNTQNIHRANVEFYSGNSQRTINDVVLTKVYPDPNWALWAKDGVYPVTNSYVNGQLVR